MFQGILSLEECFLSSRILFSKQGNFLRSKQEKIFLYQEQENISWQEYSLKDKSEVGIIVDFSRDCTVVNGV